MTALAERESGAVFIVRKFCRFAQLSSDDQRQLDLMVQERVRTANIREDLVREGDVPDTMRIILSGWACRYSVLEDGRRQIVSLLLPGDCCDFQSGLLSRMDHSIGALTATTYVEIPNDVLDRVIQDRPLLTRAFWKDALVTAATQREWTLNLGQRTAVERLAHLFCEVFMRLRTVGLTRGNSCAFPITQADIGDATGLSTVHVNRSLQELRATNLLKLSGRTLTIPNWSALKAAALFSDRYLHLNEQ